MNRRGMRTWRINGFKVRYGLFWGGWMATHFQDGRWVHGSDSTLKGLRRGVHVVTSQATREKLQQLLNA